MDNNKKEMIKKLSDWAISTLELGTYADDELEALLKERLEEICGEKHLSVKEKVETVKGAFNSIRGLGILDSILEDEDVTEIMINGHEDIFIEKNGMVRRYPDGFESEEKLEDIIQKIVGRAGREVNQSNPIVDTRLPDGSRVNVVLPPIALCGATMTIRKFSREPMTMSRLIELGSLTLEIAEILKKLVEARYNIFICGGTGSGKTTFLNALSNYIPADERIITIEDSAELQIENKENLVSLETRNANVTGCGSISIRELIRASLRMRPERIIVGEVRGEEALDMLQAMNTGHDGSLSTGHANSSYDMLSRLETMVLQGSSGLPLQAVRRQIASAVDIIIHLSRLSDHTRRTMEISELCGVKDGEIVLNPLYEFKKQGVGKNGIIQGGLVRTGKRLENRTKLEMAGIELDI